MDTTADDPLAALGALRRDGDRAAVRFERTYPAGVDDVWSALTRPERLARWLAEVTGDLAPGGRYRLDFGDDATTGEVVTCEPPRLLEVTWEFPGEPASRVLVELSAADGGARLVLDHSQLPPAQAAEYGAGWHAHLAGLAAEAGDEAGSRPAPDWDAAFAAALPRYRALAARP